MIGAGRPSGSPGRTRNRSLSSARARSHRALPRRSRAPSSRHPRLLERQSQVFQRVVGAAFDRSQGDTVRSAISRSLSPCSWVWCTMARCSGVSRSKSSVICQRSRARSIGSSPSLAHRAARPRHAAALGVDDGVASDAVDPRPHLPASRVVVLGMLPDLQEEDVLCDLLGQSTVGRAGWR